MEVDLSLFCEGRKNVVVKAGQSIGCVWGGGEGDSL